MNKDDTLLFAGLMMVMILMFLCGILGMDIGIQSGRVGLNKELVERGHKHYDAKTGKLVWSEEK